MIIFHSSLTPPTIWHKLLTAGILFLVSKNTQGHNLRFGDKFSAVSVSVAMQWSHIILSANITIQSNLMLIHGIYSCLCSIATMRWKIDHQFENCTHPSFDYVSYNNLLCCNTIYAFHYSIVTIHNPSHVYKKGPKKHVWQKKWFAIKITIVICICWYWHSWFDTNFSQNTCAFFQRLFFLMC